jgi:hypothetical protein
MAVELRLGEIRASQLQDLEGIDWRHPERTWQPRMAV